MIDDAVALSTDNAPSLQRPRAFKAILYGGLAAGMLDGLAAAILSGLRGVSPIRVFQYIASGLIGRASFRGGVATVLLGVLLHFLIASIFAAIYYGASCRLPALIRQAVRWGLIYGVTVYFAMKYIVLPLSAVQRAPFSPAALLEGMIVHAFCVGLPIALFAQHYSKAH